MQTASYRILLCMMIVPCIAAKPTTGPSVPPRTAPIEQRIAAVRELAARIKIDGKAADWEGIPAYPDPRGDSTATRAALDFTKTAIAPCDDALLIMVATVAKPIDEDWAYHFNIDFVGSVAADIKVSLRAKGKGSVYAAQTNKVTLNIPIEYAIGDVLEVRLPWDLFPPVLEEAQVKEWRTSPRSYVRVTPFSMNPKASVGTGDRGASAACFRLVKGLLQLDPPQVIPQAPAKAALGVAATPLPLPVQGQWYVAQGPFGEDSHSGEWAYDILMVNNALQVNPRGTKVNADDLAWGRPIFAPIGGRVNRAVGDKPDNLPGARPESRDTPANEVLIDIDQTMRLALLHMAQGSVKVTTGATVNIGAALGAVGNSGFSDIPHLHIAMWQLPRAEKTLPIAFEHVRVSINPVADDYWSRDLEQWEPREGWLVENLPRK